MGAFSFLATNHEPGVLTGQRDRTPLSCSPGRERERRKRERFPVPSRRSVSKGWSPCLSASWCCARDQPVPGKAPSLPSASRVVQVERLSFPLRVRSLLHLASLGCQPPCEERERRCRLQKATCCSLPVLGLQEWSPGSWNTWRNEQPSTPLYPSFSCAQERQSSRVRFRRGIARRAPRRLPSHSMARGRPRRLLCLPPT